MGYVGDVTAGILPHLERHFVLRLSANFFFCPHHFVDRRGLVDPQSPPLAQAYQ